MAMAACLVDARVIDTVLGPEALLLNTCFAENKPEKDTSVFEKKLKYYIPSIAWIPQYDPSL
jgi:hypothetical protein